MSSTSVKSAVRHQEKHLRCSPIIYKNLCSGMPPRARCWRLLDDVSVAAQRQAGRASGSAEGRDRAFTIREKRLEE
jgi:hypothetical protein